MRKPQRVSIYFLTNPDSTLKQASQDLSIPKGTIQKIVAEEVKRERAIYIVPSLVNECEYFVFNNLNERVMYTDYENRVTNGELFNMDEKREIQRNGFRILNY